jgi:hypothetical protein
MCTMYESCARVCGVCGHDVHLFATADKDADTKKSGAATATHSDSDSGESDGDNGKGAEAEAITTTASMIPGQKIELIDGDGKTWATTIVIDVEPKMPDDWHKDAKAGDYILVRGGLRLPASTLNGTKPMTIATNWKDVKLFKKPPKRSKVTDYQRYPGILQYDWAFFDRDITPAALMRAEEFLVDVQHSRAKKGKVKGET